MDRKDLFLEESKQNLSSDDISKLRKAVDDGGLYLALVNSEGWKALVEEYINKRLSQERFLTARVEELADIRAEQRELFNLLRFIQRKIDAGQKALEVLKNSNK